MSSAWADNIERQRIRRFRRNTVGRVRACKHDEGIERVSAILIASHQGSRGAQWLSDQSGKPVLTLPGTVTGEPGTDSLGGLISRIVSALLEAGGAQPRD